MAAPGRRLVVHYTDSMLFGGAEQALLTLLAHQDRRRWRPVLLHHPLGEPSPLIEDAHRLEVETRATPRPRGRAALPGLLALVRVLRAARPSVFHAHLSWPPACRYGLLAAIMARVPAIIATQQLFMPVSRSRAVALRVLASGVDRYVAVSGEVARCLHRDLRIPSGRITVVHNSVELRALAPDACQRVRAELGVSDQTPLVLTPARLHEQKGHTYLLQAAARVPGATFVLAGDGPLRAELEAEARRLGVADRVLFLGERSDVPNLLAACDLFVLPSLYEGLPLSVLEAMTAGVPVVATAVGGTDEAVVHEQTGLLAPPTDPPALAGAIRRLLADPALRARFTAAGQARVRQEFSAPTMAQRVERVYDDVLAATSQHGD